ASATRVTRWRACWRSSTGWPAAHRPFKRRPATRPTRRSRRSTTSTRSGRTAIERCRNGGETAAHQARGNRSPLRGGDMPKVSAATASRVEDMGVMEGRYEELDGYTVGFESFRESVDATPLFKGLPDDRCQSPHWGYVMRGKVTFKFADRDEVYETGDAYYAPPGHLPVVEAGADIVQVSPTVACGRTMAVMVKTPAAAA